MSIKASTNKRAHKRTNREKFDLQNHNKRASSCEMKGRKDEEETKLKNTNFGPSYSRIYNYSAER